MAPGMGIGSKLVHAAVCVCTRARACVHVTHSKLYVCTCKYHSIVGALCSLVRECVSACVRVSAHMSEEKVGSRGSLERYALQAIRMLKGRLGRMGEDGQEESSPWAGGEQSMGRDERHMGTWGLA